MSCCPKVLIPVQKYMRCDPKIMGMRYKIMSYVPRLPYSTPKKLKDAVQKVTGSTLKI
jgi:hypothetical protein